MNLCILTRSTTFHNKSGGLETQNKTLCEGLVKKGHFVVVITTSLENSSQSKVENGVSYIFVGAPSGVYSKKWWQESLKKFKELNTKHTFDVVISQSSAGKSVFSSTFSAKRIVINHGTSLGELKSRFKSLKNLRNTARFVLKDIPSFFGWYAEDLKVFSTADKIVCVSAILAKSLVGEYPSYEEKVVVIDNGVDLSRFSFIKKRVDPKDSFVLLYIGRVVEEKGIGELLKAVAFIKENIPNIYLYIVGGGPSLNKFKKISLDIGIKDVVNYVGELDNREVVKYYEKSDVFVYPSLRQEGFPMVLAEAMVSGLPIVASRIGGIPSAVDDNRTGILVDPGSIDKLAGAIERLYKDSSLRLRMSNSAMEKAQSCYSQKTMVEKYIKLFS